MIYKKKKAVVVLMYKYFGDTNHLRMYGRIAEWITLIYSIVYIIVETLLKSFKRCRTPEL